MINLIIIANVIISFCCLYATFKIRMKLAPQIKKMVKHIKQVQQQTNILMSTAPAAIAHQQQQITETCHQYQQLTAEMQKIAQILTVIKFAQNYYGRGQNKSK
jgi:hypothetical protein